MRSHTQKEIGTVSIRFLAAYILSRRMATPCHRCDIEHLFSRLGPQLYEMFLETLEHILQSRECLVFGPIDTALLKACSALDAAAIHAKTNILDKHVGHSDGTVLRVTRLDDNDAEEVVYNYHKHAQGLKIQGIGAPNGLLIHYDKPLKERIHDWILYTRSGRDMDPENVLHFEGRKFCIYGDSAYNECWFLDCLFCSGALNDDQCAFNTAMARLRMTVERVFKEVKDY